MATPDLTPEDQQFYDEYVDGIMCLASAEFVRHLTATLKIDGVDGSIQPVLDDRRED